MSERNEILSYLIAKLAEAPSLAKEKTKDNEKPFEYRKSYYRIQKYADDFLTGKTSESRIIVLPGLRGVGKTTLLLQLYKYLTLSKQIEQERVLYFSADELKEYIGANISDIIKILVEDIFKTSLVDLNKKLFILIDEAHFDKNWSTSAKVVYDKTKNIFLLITGSSALNIEMSVDLARRAKKEVIFPLIFSEYLKLKYNISSPSTENIKELIFNPSLLKNAKDEHDELIKKMLPIGKPLEKEFEYFLSSGGFPFSLNLDEKDTYERIFSMIERVIEKDIFSIQSFNTETRNLITRIIYYLALQKPGETSDAKLSQRLGTSSKLIRNILDVLEKTHLVFSIKAYGSAGKIIRKSWKYYFLSPSISAAIRFKLGAYNMKDRDMVGTLAENLVASYFFRMKETTNIPLGIFYDSDKEGVDFLLKDADDNIIPVEVSVGDKDKRQIKKAIKKYKSKYGIIISNREVISKEDDVIFIPITTFSFV